MENNFEKANKDIGKFEFLKIFLYNFTIFVGNKDGRAFVYYGDSNPETGMSSTMGVVVYKDGDMIYGHWKSKNSYSLRFIWSEGKFFERSFASKKVTDSQEDEVIHKIHELDDDEIINLNELDLLEILSKINTKPMDLHN
jgi:hypothetical protein